MSQRENSKELILNEAVQLASVQGLNGLTIGSLARELDMSKGGICAHYPSKQHLQLAVVEKARFIFTRTVIDPALESAPGLSRLKALIAAWFDYLKAGTFRGGCFFTNCVLELDDLEDEEVRAAVTRQYNRFIRFVEACAKDAIAQKEFSSGLDLEQFSFEFMGGLLSSLLWRGLGRDSSFYTRGNQTLAGLLERSKAA